MTTTTKPQIFKGELQQFADLLKSEGMRIYYSPNDRNEFNTYLYFTDGSNIGYCQLGYFGGIRISTVHKPCHECGTGFSLTNDPGIYEPTIEDAKKAFVIAPNWAKPRDRKAVVKYSNIEELIGGRQILKYVEY